MQRVLPAASRVVFRAFTDANVLRRWWGPRGFRVPALDFEPRVGGRYRIEMQPPEGDAFRLTGDFLRVDPPLHLAYTFVWEPPDPDDLETEVRLSFLDLGERTEVEFLQGGFRTEERREVHRAGWTDSFDKLEGLLAPGR